MKEIPLTHGKVALVDDADYEILMAMGKWHYKKDQGYAAKSVYLPPINGVRRQITLRMHRFIMNTPKGLETDHVDRNRLNNQRSNLRICTKSENQRNVSNRKDNTSGYKGINWNKQHRKWVVRIQVDNKRIFVGVFRDLDAAIHAYNANVLKYHGEFARLNDV